MTEIESIMYDTILYDFNRFIADKNMKWRKFREKLNRKTTIIQNFLIYIVCCYLAYRRIVMHFQSSTVICYRYYLN